MLTSNVLLVPVLPPPVVVIVSLEYSDDMVTEPVHTPDENEPVDVGLIEVERSLKVFVAV